MKDTVVYKTEDSLIISLSCQSSESDGTSSEDIESDYSEDNVTYGIRMLDKTNLSF